jgi:hypothetical protein
MPVLAGRGRLATRRLFWLLLPLLLPLLLLVIEDCIAIDCYEIILIM